MSPISMKTFTLYCRISMKFIILRLFQFRCEEFIVENQNNRFILPICRRTSQCIRNTSPKIHAMILKPISMVYLLWFHLKKNTSDSLILVWAKIDRILQNNCKTEQSYSIQNEIMNKRNISRANTRNDKTQNKV